MQFKIIISEKESNDALRYLTTSLNNIIKLSLIEREHFKQSFTTRIS